MRTLLLIILGSILFNIACKKQSYVAAPEPEPVQHFVKPEVSYKRLQNQTWGVPFVHPSTINENDTLILTDYCNDSLLSILSISIENSTDWWCYPRMGFYWFSRIKMDSCMFVTDYNYYPVPLSDSTVIDKNSEFSDFFFVFFEITCLNGNYNLWEKEEYNNKKYGLKITQNDSTYYGWMHLEFVNDSLFIREYAYRTKAEEPIKAGRKE